MAKAVVAPSNSQWRDLAGSGPSAFGVQSAIADTQRGRSSSPTDLDGGLRCQGRDVRFGNTLAPARDMMQFDGGFAGTCSLS